MAGNKDRKTALEEVRTEINAIDDELLKLLSRRRQVSQTVAEIKSSSEDKSLRDLAREEELLLRRLETARGLGLTPHFVTRIFHEIIDDSVRLQQDLLIRKDNSALENLARVAYQGGEGSFSYLAASSHFSRVQREHTYQGCADYEAVLAAVTQERADYGLLPIENTTSGGINEVYDLLLDTTLTIVGEEIMKVEHCLCALPGVRISDVRKVICNPQAFQQCNRFLATLPNCVIEYRTDSTASVQQIKSAGAADTAMIASAETAKMYGLEVLKAGLANHPENSTRFIIVARQPLNLDLTIPCKTSLVLSTAQEPGALVKALSVFQNHGINLSKLESRPILNNPWEELFYIDFEGNLKAEHVSAALDELTKRSRFIKILGCYPEHTVKPLVVRPDNKAATGSSVNGNGSVQVVKAPDAGAAKASPNIPKTYKLGSREYKAEDTIIEVKGVKIGGDNFIVMAGPCSVESEDQVLLCAEEAREAGAVILRGGCFKPRTNPYTFQGLGYAGLDLLQAAGAKFGLPIITEVMAPEDVAAVAEKADILQIGARNMQNYNLLKEVGKVHRPVMLKRGMSSSLIEFLQAAEYILAQGNQQVILCERGIRTFETSTRYTLDIAAVPVLKERTHLPIIIDPSHAAGERNLVPPLAYAARAAGAHGIIVEFHPEPEKALSDGPQSLYFDQFRSMMSNLLR